MSSGQRSIAPAAEPARLIAVVGPTAAGKSELGVRLGQRLGGEVVNADAMQLYRGMDIGTAKLTSVERAGVAHHLLDVLDVTERGSVAEYVQRADVVLDVLAERGVTAVVVGGSPLYVRGLLDVFEFPGTDPVVRARLEAELAAQGPAALHARLTSLDPRAAAQVLPSNARRIVRALEVIDLTGRPFAASLPSLTYRREPTMTLGIAVPREVLDRRIEARVQRMFADGLLEETARLLAAGLEQAPTAGRAIGYVQAMDLLAGRCTQVEAVERTVSATRRLVRRQESWLRRDPRIHWLHATSVDALLEQSLAVLRLGSTS